MGVNWKGEAGAGADALDETVDGIGHKRAAALGGEYKGAVGELPAQSRRARTLSPRSGQRSACRSW
jgi:hypothetical protein